MAGGQEQFKQYSNNGAKTIHKPKTKFLKVRGFKIITVAGQTSELILVHVSA